MATQKRDILTQCRFNVKPPSATLVQHLNDIGLTSLISWKDLGLLQCLSTVSDATQSTASPVPTRHRPHARFKMPTALPANTRQWHILKQQIGVFAGLRIGVCLHPPLLLQYICQPIRVLLAGPPANHKFTTILEIESGGDLTSAICKLSHAVEQCLTAGSVLRR